MPPTMVNEDLAKMAQSLRVSPHGLKRRESIHLEYWRREGGWQGTFSALWMSGSIPILPDLVEIIADG